MRRLLALAQSPSAIEAGLDVEELRTTALIELGSAEIWAVPLRR